MPTTLFHRPLRRDPLLWLWVTCVALAAAGACVEYVEPGAAFNADRAGAFVGVLLAAAFYAWLLLLVLALLRRGWGRWRSGRADATAGHSALPVPSPRTGTQPTAGAGRPETPVVGETFGRADRDAARHHVPSFDGEVLWTAYDDEQVRGLSDAPLGDLRLLVVADRTIRHDEPLRLDWRVPEADRVLIDGEVHDPVGALDLVVTSTRNVILQAFRGDRLLRSAVLPVTVLPAPPPPVPAGDWLGPPAAALDAALAARPLFPTDTRLDVVDRDHSGSST